MPSAAPVFNVSMITSTGIAVTWQPLPSCEENGDITSYTIAVRMKDETVLNFTELVVPGSNRTAVISQLTPYTIYTIKMAASTSAGRGVFGTEVQVLTNESGNTQWMLRTILGQGR